MSTHNTPFSIYKGGGWVVRWYWVNFQCWGVLLIWIRVGQGPTALAVGAGGVVWTFFSLVYRFSFLSPSLWETVQYKLKYCLKGPLSPKQTTNQSMYKRKSASIIPNLQLLDCFPRDLKTSSKQPW